LGFTERHQSCDCEKYTPDFIQFQVRLDGTNYRCRGCSRYVSSLKWKGGLIERKNYSKGKGTIMVYIGKNFCPCCGQKMSLHRVAKKKLIDSVQKQIDRHWDNPLNTEILPSKIKFLKEKLAVPFVH
jgi:hypothetical protein